MWQDSKTGEIVGSSTSLKIVVLVIVIYENNFTKYIFIL